MSVRALRVDIACRGIAANVLLTLAMEGDPDKHTEVIYRHSFSGMAGPAAVRGLRVLMPDGRDLVSKIEKRADAQDGYEDGLAQGQRTCLVEAVENARGTVELSCGVLPPNEIMIIRLECVVTASVSAERNALELSFPGTMFPAVQRLEGDGAREPLSPWGTELRWGEQAVFVVGWEGEDVGTAFLSDTHTVGAKGEHGWPLSARGDTEIESHVHVLAPLTCKKELLLARGCVSARGESLLSLGHCVECEEGRSQVDFMFVADKSGSMAGANMRSLAQALKLCVRALGGRVPFNIVFFDTDCFTLDKPGGFGGGYYNPRCRDSEEEVDRIFAMIDSVRAGGTTNIDVPLRRIKSVPLSHGCSSRVVFVLTDGLIDNLKSVVDLLASFDATTHLFVGLGLGNEVNVATIRALGQNSAYSIVRSPEALARSTMSLLGKAMSGELLSRVRVRTGDIRWQRFESEPDAVLPAGKTAVFWSGAPPGDVDVSAKSASQGKMVYRVGGFADGGEDATALLAAAHVEDLRSKGASSDEVTKVALEAHIVTAETSLLLVDRDGDIEMVLPEAPERRKVENARKIVVGSSAFDDDKKAVKAHQAFGNPFLQAPGVRSRGARRKGGAFGGGGSFGIKPPAFGGRGTFGPSHAAGGGFRSAPPAGGGGGFGGGASAGGGGHGWGRGRGRGRGPMPRRYEGDACFGGGGVVDPLLDFEEGEELSDARASSSGGGDALLAILGSIDNRGLWSVRAAEEALTRLGVPEHVLEALRAELDDEMATRLVLFAVQARFPARRVEWSVTAKTATRALGEDMAQERTEELCARIRAFVE